MKINRQKLIFSLLSGLAGAILTIGYQHFFVKPQSFTFVINGEEVVLTKEDYLEQQNQVELLQSDITNLETINNTLIEENETLNSEIDNLNTKIDEYSNKLSDVPDIQFKDLALSIEGDNMPINSINSSVIINSRTYYAEEFINSILGTDTNISIQNDTMYIGKNIKDKTSLLDEWVVDKNHVDVGKSVVNSYGNTHENTLFFEYNGAYIIYNLDEKYSLMKFNVSISEGASLDCSGTLVIKADGEIVYTYSDLTKTTRPFDVVDVPLNNCSLLTIEYKEDYSYNNCILSDIEVYN